MKEKRKTHRCGTRGRHQRPSQRHGGFTLLGLLIVVTILALVSTTTMTSINLMARRQAEDQLLRIGAQYSRAFQQYAEATPMGLQRFPASLQDLVKDPRYTETRRYLREVYPDPLTGKVDWGVVLMPEGGIAGIYSNAKGTPIRQQGVNKSDETLSIENYGQWQFGLNSLPLTKK